MAEHLNEGIPCNEQLVLSCVLWKMWLCLTESSYILCQSNSHEFRLICASNNSVFTVHSLCFRLSLVMIRSHLRLWSQRFARTKRHGSCKSEYIVSFWVPSINNTDALLLAFLIPCTMRDWSRMFRSFNCRKASPGESQGVPSDATNQFFRVFCLIISSN